MKTNTRKAPEGVNLGNILELLALVAAKEFPYELIAPSCKLKEGEVVKGVITSETTKRFLTIKHWLSEAAEAANAKHQQLHDCPTAVITELDCKESAMEILGLLGRAELMNRLMWFSTREAFPQEAVNSTGLREDWQIVGLARKEWSELVLFPSPKDLPNLILGQLLDTVSGKPTIGEDDDIKGAADDELGKKIGIVEDPRIRSLMAIERRLFRYADDMAAIEGVSLEKLDQKAIRAWMDGQTMGNLKRKTETIRCLADLRNLLSELFWQAVKDTVPGATDVGALVIRPGWELYEGLSSADSLDSLLGIAGIIEQITITDGKNIISPDSELGQAILQIAKLAGKGPFGGRGRTRTATT